MIFYGSKIEVNVVTDLGDSKYGVIIEDNRNMYKYISKIIDSTIHRLPMPRKIRVNDFCLAMFGDDIWHRARVTHTNPLTVYFLDFANEEECTLEYLRIIPKDLDDHELEDVEEELMFLTKIPPLAFKIQTEQYVTLEEGSLAKIVLQEEIEHNHWMVAIIREKDRQLPNSSKRLEIVADPQHVEKHIKKKKNKAPEVQKPSNVGYSSASAPSKVSSATSRKLQDEIISLSEDDSDVEFVSQHKMSTNKKQNSMRGDKSSLVYSAVCHQPEFDNIPPPISASRRIKPIVISDESEPEFDNIPPPPSSKIKHDARQKQVLKNNDKKDDNIAERLGKLSIANGLSEIETKLIYDSFTSWSRDYFVDYLKPGDQLAFIVHESCANNEYCGMMICKRLERQIDALDDLDSLTPQKGYRAKRGSFVATFLNPFNQWYRGYVVSEPTNIDPTYLLILFDIGIMYRTSDVTPLPEHFLSVPLLAVRCTIPSFPSDYNEMYRLEVLPMTKTLTEVELFLQDKCIYTGIVKRRENSEIECDLQPKIGSIKTPIKVKFAPWVPTKEEMGVDCVQLKNGDVVKITAISVTNECYVVPVNEEFNEERNKFLDSVVLHCRKAKSIDHEPKVREIVGVPHIRTFWRGQVIERKKNSFTVHLLDIGADIRVSKEDMKELPDALKFVKSYAACVLLDKMQRTDFDRRSEDFLKYVVTHEKKFIVEMDESSSLVNLKFAEEIECRKWKMRKGSSFNETMNDMLKPLWKLSDTYDFGSLFFLSNFKFEEWEVGSILSLLFVEKLDPKNGTFINPRGDVYAKLVEVNLTLRLTEYAEEKPDSYVPISNELCVAKYDDGLWYRAVCVCAEPGKDLQLQFIDIGYQRPVPHFNIRRISPDFLKHPAAALFCEITNCEETDDLSQLEGRMLRRCKVMERIEIGGYALEVENLDSYLAK